MCSLSSEFCPLNNSLELAEVFTKLVLEANKNDCFQMREQTVSQNHSATCMCEIPFGEQWHSRTCIPEFNEPAACKSSYSICCPGALCSDSLVSMESASESASLDLSNISVAADQGILIGFRISMMKIKHMNIKLYLSIPSWWTAVKRTQVWVNWSQIPKS